MKNPQTSLTEIPDELKIFSKSSPSSKKPTYIYTEEDLGEGLLEAGL